MLQATAEVLEDTDDRGEITLLKLNDESWPYLGSNILFVRDFYPNFYDANLGAYKTDTKIYVMGTPGIGKSAFGAYCIYRALKDGKTVVYQNVRKIGRVSIYQGDTVQLVRYIPEDLLNRTDGSVLYISDAVAPDQCRCPTILITSPNKEIWREFDKMPGSVRHYFGVWNRGDELELLRQHCFAETVPLAKMEEQVDIWGPVPRLALTQAYNHINTATTALSLVQAHASDILIKAAGLAETGKDDPSHRLLHLVPDPDGSQKGAGRDWASKYIAKTAVEHLLSQANDQFILMMNAFDALGRENGMFGTVFGHAFEQYSLKQLAAGGRSFKMKELPSGEPAVESFGTVPRECKLFRTLSDVQRDSATSRFLHIPKASNFAALDCLTLSKDGELTAFNATSNSNKGKLVMDTTSGKLGLFRVAQSVLKAKDTTPIRFVFAVPPNTFETFKMPANFAWQVNADPGQEAKIPRPTPDEKVAFERRIRFYAMCVPFRSLHTAVKRVMPRRLFF